MKLCDIMIELTKFEGTLKLMLNLRICETYIKDGQKSLPISESDRHFNASKTVLENLIRFRT
jgi:hypothetical protein